MSLHVHQAEAAITLAMLDGSLDNLRLRHTLEQLDRGRWRMELTELRQSLGHSGAPTTAEGLWTVLDDLRQRHRLGVADAQVLAIGFYRLMWRLLARLDRTVTLDELRGLPPACAAQVCYGFTFGSQPEVFPLPEPMLTRMNARVLRFMARGGIDQEWREADPLPLGVPVVTTGDRQLSAAANAIRNTFFAWVFTEALLTDHGPRVDEVLLSDVLFAADEAPERIVFLRRMSREQACFRLRQLCLAVIALHQQACCWHASSGRVRHELVVACLLSPFVTLRSWLRANRERVWIPLVRQTATGDIVVLSSGRPIVAEPSGMAQRRSA